jgi:hypothetical protein
MTTSIKTRDLSTFFKQFAQTLVKAMGSQGNKVKPSTYNHDSNVQAQTVAQALPCVLCGHTGHFISECLVYQSYITEGKCKRNSEGKVVLPNGQYCPCSMPGQFIKEQLDKWHKQNPKQSTSPEINTLTPSTSTSLMYEILPITKTSLSEFASANMVSTPPFNVFIVDQCIAVLEQEILTL